MSLNGTITRRTLIAGSALASGAAMLPGTLPAAAPPTGRQAAALYRYRVGSFEVTALYDGIWNRAIDERFVTNVAWADVQKALADNFMPPATLPTPFTALLVNTGAKLVLIDTGTAGQLASTAGSMNANLAAAGIDPRAIDIILISHFHSDHINGIKTKDGAKVFPNAEICVPAADWRYWMDDANLNAAPEPAKGAFRNARRIFSDIAREITHFAPGKEVAPGITAIAAPGHTPGHTVFAVASGNQSVLALGDTTNHPWLFARNPDWRGVFDVDGRLAAETRRKLLDRAAADRMLVQGYHFPFPATGHIARTAKGYDFVPAMWQPSL